MTDRRRLPPEELDARLSVIASARLAGLTWAEIGAQLGMTLGAVRDLALRHAPSLLDPVAVPAKHRERIALMRQLRADGLTWQAIGQHLGVTKQAVNYLACRYAPDMRKRRK